MKKALMALLCVSIIGGVWGYQHISKPDEELTLIHSNNLIPKRTKTELVGLSEVIVRGTVKEALPSRWSNPNGEKGQEARNVIQTDIVVGVEEIFKGAPYQNQEVKVRINKGQVGQTKWVSESYPDFTTGEEMILFLVPDSSEIADVNEQYYVLAGMRQGKFVRSENTGQDKTFLNGEESIQLGSFKDEIPKELEKYKQMKKPEGTDQGKSKL